MFILTHDQLGGIINNADRVAPELMENEYMCDILCVFTKYIAIRNPGAGLSYSGDEMDKEALKGHIVKVIKYAVSEELKHEENNN